MRRMNHHAPLYFHERCRREVDGEHIESDERQDGVHPRYTQGNMNAEVPQLVARVLGHVGQGMKLPRCRGHELATLPYLSQRIVPLRIAVIERHMLH